MSSGAESSGKAPEHSLVMAAGGVGGARRGSVAEVATAEGFTVDRKQVVIPTPIKELGLHDVDVVLHPEVTASVQLNVARSAEEAELQASGKSIQELAAEEEAAAEFEIQELFDDIGAAASEDEELAESAGVAPVETPEDETSDDTQP